VCGSVIEAPIMARMGNVAASRESSPGLNATRGAAALLLLAVLAPATAVVARNSRRVSGFCDVVVGVFIGMEIGFSSFRATREKYQLA